MKKTCLTGILTLLVTAVLFAPQMALGQYHLAPHSQFARSQTAEPTANKTVRKLLASARSQLTNWWANNIGEINFSPSNLALPSWTGFWGSLTFIHYLKDYFDESATLFASAIEEVAVGTSYEQFVGRKDRQSVLLPRYELRVEALAASYLISDKEHLKELQTYQLVLYDVKAGKPRSLVLGKSLHHALGCMNIASKLLSQRKSLAIVFGILRQSLRFSAAGFGWGETPEYFPDLKIYADLPSGPSRRDKDITRVRDKLLARFSFAPGEKDTWTRVLEGYCRTTAEMDFTDTIASALVSTEPNKAYQQCVTHDPLWATRLTTLPIAERTAIIDTHLRSLPALHDKISVLMATLHQPDHAPLLAEQLAEIYFHGDFFGRRGLAAIQASLIEHGFIQGKALMYSMEEQIRWGLQKILGETPEEFDGYVRPLGFSKPLESRAKWQHLLIYLAAANRTQMNRAQLLSYFEKLSDPDQNSREQNLWNTMKLSSSGRINSQVFNALADRVEDCLVTGDDSLEPLLHSMHFIVRTFGESFVRPFVTYLQDPERNSLVKNILVQSFSEIADPEVAKALLALYQSPTLWDTVPQELLLRGILQSGDVPSILDLFRIVLQRRSTQAMQQFIAAWPLAAMNIDHVNDLRDLFDVADGAIQKGRLSYHLRLQIGRLFVQLASIPPGALHLESSVRESFASLQHLCMQEALVIFHETWDNGPVDLRETAADELLALHRISKNTAEIQQWEKHKKSLHEDLARTTTKPGLREAVDDLFQVSPLVLEITNQIIPSPKLFSEALQTMTIDRVHRLDALLPENSNMSVTLVRTSLPHGLFKDFLLVHEPTEKGETGNLLCVFVKDREKNGAATSWEFVQLPPRYWPAFRSRLDTFPWQRIVHAPPHELSKNKKIFIPFYMLQSLNTGLLDRVKQEIVLNLMTRHLLAEGKVEGLTTSEGLIRLWTDEDLIGAHFPSSRSIMKPFGPKTGVGEFAHEMFHDVYVFTMNFEQRRKNRGYFAGTFRAEAHPMVHAIEGKYPEDIADHPDVLYREALSFTAQAIASWNTETFLGTPILYSDIDHLDQLGLLPSVMRLSSLGMPVTDTPVRVEYYQNVLRKLKETATQSGSSEDAASASYHERLWLHAGHLPASPVVNGLDNLLRARLWNADMRAKVELMTLSMEQIKLKGGASDPVPLLTYVADAIKDAEAGSKSDFAIGSLWVTGDLFGQKDASHLEIVVGIKGAYPHQPTSASWATGKDITVSPSFFFGAVRDIHVRIVGEDTEFFQRLYASHLWKNAILLSGKAPATFSRAFARDGMLQRLRSLQSMPWAEIMQNLLDLSLRSEALAWERPIKINVGTLSAILQELENPLTPEQETMLRDNVPGWISENIATLEQLDNVSGMASPALFGRSTAPTDAQAIRLAKENSLTIPDAEQSELRTRFLSNLFTDQRKALEMQHVVLTFSSNFSALMVREGNQIFVDKHLCPHRSSLSPPEGMSAEQYSEIRRALSRILLAHELVHRDFTCEEELYAICQEFIVAMPLAKQRNGPQNIRLVLKHLGLNPYDTNVDEFVELAKTIHEKKWDRPHVICPAAIKAIVPFATRYYSLVAGQDVLDRNGQVKMEMVGEIFNVLDNFRFQHDPEYRLESISNHVSTQVTQGELQDLAGTHAKTSLTKTFFLTANFALQKKPMDASGLPMIYCFALPPKTFQEVAAAAKTNPALHALLLVPTTLAAAHRDFLRQSRLLPGSALREPLEFLDAVSRAESVPYLDKLNLPLDNPRANILDASDSVCSFLTPALENLAGNQRRTASVTVSHKNPQQVAVGKWVSHQNTQSLRLDHIQDDLASSNIQSKSMDAVLITNLVNTLPLGLPVDVNQTLMLCFAHINRILRDNSYLVLIDKEENESLLKCIAVLYGFRLLEELRVPGEFLAQRTTVLRFIKEQPVSLVHGIIQAGAVKEKIREVASALTSMLANRTVDFSLAGVPYSVPLSKAIHLIMRGVVRGEPVFNQMTPTLESKVSVLRKTLDEFLPILSSL